MCSREWADTYKYAMTTLDFVGLLIAALGGAAVGLERQWSGHAEGPGARFAGIRRLITLAADKHGFCGIALNDSIGRNATRHH